MAFSWIGTFRQGQWQAFRKFVLEERRDAATRVAVIEAERERIGKITVTYAQTEDGEGNKRATEKRVGFSVEPPSSSLSQLVSAYVALGGNPLDISMFMHPDSVRSDDDGLEDEPYPSGGVVTQQGQAYAYGGDTFKQGLSSIQAFDVSRSGGRRRMDESEMHVKITSSRGWVEKELAYKRDVLEDRILKLCDLHEQLGKEIEDIIGAVGDSVFNLPLGFAQGDGEDKYDETLTVAQVVGAIDSIWYQVSPDGTADFNTQSDALGAYPNLISDLEGGIENWTAV